MTAGAGSADAPVVSRAETRLGEPPETVRLLGRQRSMGQSTGGGLPESAAVGSGCARPGGTTVLYWENWGRTRSSAKEASSCSAG